jgi:hypothetical protein
VSLRGRLRCLEHAARGELLEIPLGDGGVARFPQHEAREAFLAIFEGRDHPLLKAARNSTDPEWQRSFYSALPIDQHAKDLSEP